MTIKSLNHYSQIQFPVNEQKIERKTKILKEIYLFQDITKLHIIRTTKGHIRKIMISSKGGNSIFINGLNDFESFKIMLINNYSKNIIIKETNEPIDIDHPLFYLFFGFSLSLTLTIFIRLMTGLNSSSMEIVYLSVLFYILITSVYMILTKPVSGKFGQKTQTTDYILGVLIFLLDIFLYFYIF